MPRVIITVRDYLKGMLMCNSCSFQANYFHSIHCIYDHLVATHPVLWLRDSSRRWPAGYISRNFLNPAGDVLAIWNGKGKGWRLRKLKNEARDEVPDPTREDFVELLNEMETFQPFLAMDE
ncbi:TPA: hypothetical protein MJD21_26190 [Klebsiella pneumoniae]|nr:hypothetical protein [Klebsiella pneumoniae]HBZ1029474.1 hypothetical protein [Klebsiella pneumoniae]HBZ1254129.1 hypothetical protein [Klebsiella pneumoniae]